MKNYKVYVWYRFNINGDDVNDYMDLDIDANSPKEAAKLSLNQFQSSKQIPFKVEVDELTFKPNEL